MSDDELEGFVRLHGTALLRFATLVTAGDDPEDVVQDCLVRIAPRLRHMTEQQALSYARRVTVNLVSDRHRRRSRGQELLRLLPVMPGADPVDDLVIERQRAFELLAQLPPRQRAVIILRFWTGLSEREIAVTLGCSTGTVKSQSSRALRSLRARLSQSTPAEDSHV